MNDYQKIIAVRIIYQVFGVLYFAVAAADQMLNDTVQSQQIKRDIRTFTLEGIKMSGDD